MKNFYRILPAKENPGKRFTRAICPRLCEVYKGFDVIYTRSMRQETLAAQTAMAMLRTNAYLIYGLLCKIKKSCIRQ